MDQSVPEDYLCPITQEMMQDPVVAADGQSYEREAIAQWLQKGHKTSPLTGEGLKHDVVIENYRLKAIIETFRRSLPDVQREKQMRADHELAIKLREEMLAQNGERLNKDIGKYAEALKKKDEENKVLQENLLNMQKQLQEIQTKMQAQESSLSIQSKKIMKVAKVAPIEVPKMNPQSIQGNKIMEVAKVAPIGLPKIDSKPQSLTSSLKCKQCSICCMQILENLILINKICMHQYCLYCVQEAGVPNTDVCFLYVCSAKMDKQRVIQFLTEKH